MLASIALWLVIVVVTVAVMTRLGHSWFMWTALSAFLGPLAWPLAVVAVHRQADSQTPSAGDILIAVAPWDLTPAWIAESVRAHGANGRAALVSVLDAEDADTLAGQASARRVEARLRAVADELVANGVLDEPVDVCVRYGAAADVLARVAEGGSYATIIVGPDGSSWHHAARGHTVSALAHRTSIQVAAVGTPR